ncbi:MAG: cytochrome b [Pseudomonadota bacterium]
MKSWSLARATAALLLTAALGYALPGMAAETAAGVPNLEEYHRLPGHIDSWIALAIVVTSLLIAAGLNSAAPAVRTAGTVLAALGCLSVCGWFLMVKGTGIFEAPREALFPSDAIKPKVLTVLAAASLISGLFLLRVAAWQNKRTDELQLPASNTPERYGRFSRVLHWSTAIMFISLIPMGFFTSMIPYDVAWRQGYYVVHKTIGFMVLLLVFVRIVWHLKSKPPGLDAGLRWWERASAKSAHILLYFMMIALPVSGFVMSTYGGKWSHFFIWDLPLWWGEDLEAIKPFGLMHKVVLPYLCMIIIGAHVIGALKHHFIDKHRDSIHRMVS